MANEIDISGHYAGHSVDIADVEAGDLMTPKSQRFARVRTDKTRCTGNDDPHAVILQTLWGRCAICRAWIGRDRALVSFPLLLFELIETPRNLAPIVDREGTGSVEAVQTLARLAPALESDVRVAQHEPALCALLDQPSPAVDVMEQPDDLCLTLLGHELLRQAESCLSVGHQLHAATTGDLC